MPPYIISLHCCTLYRIYCTCAPTNNLRAPLNFRRHNIHWLICKYVICMCKICMRMFALYSDDHDHHHRHQHQHVLSWMNDVKEFFKWHSSHYITTITNSTIIHLIQQWKATLIAHFMLDDILLPFRWSVLFISCLLTVLVLY